MSTLKHAFNAKDMNSLVYRIVEGKVGFIFFYPFDKLQVSNMSFYDINLN